MSFTKRPYWLVLLVVVCCLSAGPSMQAAESSHNINAKGVGGAIAPLPGWFACTAGHTIGGGLLNGTTEACFDIVGFTETSLLFQGYITFATNQGTLTSSFAGELNFFTGDFSGEGDVAASTGKLAGASGHLAFEGVQNLTDFTFTDTITGSISVDLQK